MKNEELKIKESDNNLSMITDLYELYEDICPKKLNGDYVMGLSEFIHMIDSIDEFSIYLYHVLHLQHVSILRNIKLWTLLFIHKKIMRKEKNRDKN